MPKISSLMPRAFAASLAAVSVLASAASAQQPPDGPHPRHHRKRRRPEADDQVARGHRHEGAHHRQCGGVRRRQDRAVGNQEAPISASPRCRSPTAPRRRSRSTFSPRPSAAPPKVSGPGICVRTRTMTNATVARDGQGHRRPEHPGQVQGRRKESRGAAGHADRHLRRRRQVRAESRAPRSSSSARRRRTTARWKPTASTSAATASRRRCEGDAGRRTKRER